MGLLIPWGPVDQEGREDHGLETLPGGVEAVGARGIPTQTQVDHSSNFVNVIHLGRDVDETNFTISNEQVDN